MKSLDFTRADRLQDQIKRELSQIINNKVKDPRLYGLTLTRVELSEDKKQAYVYFSSFNSLMVASDLFTMFILAFTKTFSINFAESAFALCGYHHHHHLALSLLFVTSAYIFVIFIFW